MATAPTKVKPELHINLLRPQGAPAKLPQVFLKWLLNYGRLILIGVEIVVLSTFAMRFKLDAELSDLKEAIQNQVYPIEAYAHDEQLIRQTQYNLDFIKNSLTQASDFSKALISLGQDTPQGIQLSNLNIDAPSPASTPTLRMTGAAATNLDLVIFISKLRSDPTFQNVTLANLTLDQEKINFSITADLSQEALN